MVIAATSSREEREITQPAPGPQPTRRCVGCGRRGEQSGFLRLTLDCTASPRRVVMETGRKRSGRGAYLCLKQACLDQALHRKAFQRAFRAAVAVDRNQVAAAIVTRAGYGEANDTAGG